MVQKEAYILNIGCCQLMKFTVLKILVGTGQKLPTWLHSYELREQGTPSRISPQQHRISEPKKAVLDLP